MLKIVDSSCGHVCFTFNSWSELKDSFPNGIMEGFHVESSHLSIKMKFPSDVFNGGVQTHSYVEANRINNNLMFQYNTFLQCEILDVSIIPDEVFEAERSYFAEYGTACE